MSNRYEYIYAQDIDDYEDFENLLRLHNCINAGTFCVENETYYVIEGSKSDLDSFCRDWIM